MKTLLSILLLMTIFVAAGAVCGQAVPAKTSDAWVRFESKSKDFSIELPADYLVDNNDGTVTLYCFGVGYKVSVWIGKNASRKPAMKEYAARATRNVLDLKDFQIGDFVGMEKIQVDAKTNIHTYYIDFASTRGNYSLTANADDSHVDIVDRIRR